MSETRRELPRHRLVQPVTVKWFVAIFGASLLYAIVRYHIAGDVEWRHFPLFILNKATSIAAVAFVASSYLIGKIIHWHDDDNYIRLVVIKFCGLMGFFMAGIHAMFSLSLLTPAYYGKYFDEIGRLNLQGELAMSAGVIGLFCLLGPALTTLPMMPKALGGQRWKRNQRLGYVALLLVVAHLIALGIRGWLAPEGWPAGLPPISLLATLIALSPLVVRGKLTNKKQSRKDQ